MATTTAADNAASSPIFWAEDTFTQAESYTFWNQFEGARNAGLPIVRRDDLSLNAGKQINVDVLLKLRGPGVSGELSVLEGNEEKLNYRQIAVTVTDFAHAVAWTFLSETQIDHNMREDAQTQLSKWIAGKLDDRMFTEITGVVVADGVGTGTAGGNTVIPTLCKMAAGTATSRATIADTDAGGRLTWNSIMEAKAYARQDLKIEPIRIDSSGNEWFGLVVSEYAALSLQRDDVKWSNAQRDAAMRGTENALFTGAVGVVSGVIIWTSSRVPVYTNGSVMVADNIFFGVNMASRAFNLYPTWVETSRDYGRKIGIGSTTVVGEKLNAFDLTQAGGAATSAYTTIGSLILYSASVAPGL